MSLAIESDVSSSSFIEEEGLYWDENFPKELQQEAILVSQLALDLFQKLKVHPNVYIPFNQNSTKDWCNFHWSTNGIAFGSIRLDRDLETVIKGQKKETDYMLIMFFRDLNKKEPANLNDAYFPDIKSDNFWTNIPQELQREAKNLLNVAFDFFKKLSTHPDVIIFPADYMNEWLRFLCFNENGNFCRSIAFSDELNGGKRVQQILIKIKA